MEIAGDLRTCGYDAECDEVECKTKDATMFKGRNTTRSGDTIAKFDKTTRQTLGVSAFKANEKQLRTRVPAARFRIRRAALNYANRPEWTRVLNNLTPGGSTSALCSTARHARQLPRATQPSDSQHIWNHQTMGPANVKEGSVGFTSGISGISPWL
jgi:hypothetical protein